MIQGGNVTVFVSDMDRAVRFYTEALGLRLRDRSGDHWAEIETRGLTIALHPAREAPSGKPDGRLSIGFEVAELEATIEQLRARGAQVDPNLREDGPVRIAYLRDPDGTPLYLCQVKSAPAEAPRG